MSQHKVFNRSHVGPYSTMLSAPPAFKSSPFAGCWARPCLTASTMILAPIPTVTMPATIWAVTSTRVTSVVAVMSPNPTVANTVTVKYKASVRVRAR